MKIFVRSNNMSSSSPSLFVRSGKCSKAQKNDFVSAEAQRYSTVTAHRLAKKRRQLHQLVLEAAEEERRRDLLTRLNWRNGIKSKRLKELDKQ